MIKIKVYVLSLLFLGGCSLSSLVDGADTSSEVKDPAAVRTPEGAAAMYNGVKIAFARVVRGTAPDAQTINFVRLSGLFTDELRAANMNADFPIQADEGIDSRTVSNIYSQQLYQNLNNLRALSQETRGLLKEIKIADWEKKVAEVYAIEAFVTIMLADMYCSSIPLSFLNYGGDYTITEGFSTETVYERAISLFDSAKVVLSTTTSDSSGIEHFINIGRGRALLSLGEYETAASQVSAVPTSYKYQLDYTVNYPKDVAHASYFIIADKEGINGLGFVSDNDPRTATAEHTNKLIPLTFAGGIEGRLIEVEAMIHARNDEWINSLNRLRTSCISQDDCITPAPAGTGGIAGLPMMTDSSLGLPDAEKFDKRLDILFHERAYWLFLTGRRQGDLRRLIRRYGRSSSVVYPTGTWGNRGFTAYGTAVSFAIPQQEIDSNSLYNGCVSQDE